MSCYDRQENCGYYPDKKDENKDNCAVYLTVNCEDKDWKGHEDKCDKNDWKPDFCEEKCEEKYEDKCGDKRRECDSCCKVYVTVNCACEEKKHGKCEHGSECCKVYVTVNCPDKERKGSCC